MKISKRANGDSPKVNSCAEAGRRGFRTDFEEKDPKLEACDHIKSAIDILGSIAESDTVARDSIANLGVVYFDLK